MDKNLIARASTTINAPSERVWDALVNPGAIKQYMFGTDVVSDWREGSPIVWKGEWQGQAYEDKGVILQLKPERTIQYSHFSPLSGVPDKPENYHNELDWMLQTPDQEMNHDIVELLAGADTAPIGYPTASGMIPYCASVAENPSASKGEREIAQAVYRIHAIVISNTQEQLPGDNSELLTFFKS